MSFDIFVQKLDMGAENAVYDIDFVRSIMCRGLIKPYDLTYADGGGAETFGLWDEENPTSFMFNHCGGRIFFERLHELADKRRASSTGHRTYPAIGARSQARNEFPSRLTFHPSKEAMSLS